MRKILLILFISFISSTFFYGQRKQTKSIEQKAKEWTLKFVKMNPIQKRQAASELAYFLNNTDGYTKNIWMTTIGKYTPKEDETSKKERSNAEEEKMRTANEEQEAMQQDQLRLEEEQRRKREQYESSEYANIISKISYKLDNLLIKGEFEKTEDYNKRLESVNSVFDSICYKEIASFFESRSNSETLVTEMLGYDKEIKPFFSARNGNKNTSLNFSPYDADKELFSFRIQYRDLKFTYELHIPIDNAKNFWSETERRDDSNSGYSSYVQKWREFNLEYSKKLVDWVIMDYNFYPTKVFLNFGNKDNINYEVKLPLNGANRITISSKNLKLNNYKGTTMTFELDTYIKKLDDKEIQK